HSRLLPTVVAVSYACFGTDFKETAVSLILVQVVGRAVIGYVQVLVAVIIIIAPDCSQSIVSGLLLHAGLTRDVGEDEIAIISKEAIRRSLQSPGSAGNRNLSVAAKFSFHGQVVDIVIEVVHQVDIQVAVSVIVSCSRRR